MNIRDLKLVYLVISIILGISILAPTFARYISLPREPFSEMWLLGPNHLAEDYPFNVTSGQLNTIYLGIGNHMGDLEYYLVYAKVRNLTDPIPDIVNGTPADLSPLSEYRVFLSENDIWERQVQFSIDSVSFEENISRVSKLSIDGYTFTVDKSIDFDVQNNGFYCELIFELWRFNVGLSSFEFHNRFVGIWLNVTQSS